MLCQVFPEEYQTQLDHKVARLQALLPVETDMTVFASPPQHYRARAEFRVWHEGDESFYIMFDGDSKQKVRVDRCPMAIEAIDNLMPELMAAINADAALRHKLFQVDFLATLSGEMLVTLIYRRPIEEDPAWSDSVATLKAQLPITHVIGRARKQKILKDNDYVVERLTVDNKTFIYQQVENSFTQPNAYVAQQMLGWARSMAGKYLDGQGDLIELYCGNGNFSIALADRFRRVLATEISKTSVASAQFNIAANQVENLTIIKMAAEEVSEALAGKAFNRLQSVDLASYDFQAILVDPPRAGLDDLTRSMVTEYEHILYISCNPETLARDLESILQTHEAMETALFDQFPYTHHIESGVFLKRKS
jgi:tRNA (uracil-5-)-methyltransferase